MEDNELLYQIQFWFSKQHSTSHAITTLIEKLSTALDRWKIVVGVFLDFKKAFDTIDNTLLFKKNRTIWNTWNIHDWFWSYLNNRSQLVHYNYYNSERKHITHGVPQGSILGPQLCIIYINDFSRCPDLLFLHFIRWWHKYIHRRHKIWQTNWK